MSVYLKKFGPDDWRIFKTIRLEALSTEPYNFGGRHILEVGLSDDEWRDRLSHPDDGAFWGLYDNDECIGLTGIKIHVKFPGSMVLSASYIRKEYRRQGISAMYYQTRIDWAREQGFKDVHVAHREGNDASRAANQKFGFIHIQTEPTLWPDGTLGDKLWYRLEL